MQLEEKGLISLDLEGRGKEDTHSQKNKHSVEVKILLNFYTPIIYRKSGIRSRVSNYFHEIFGQDLLSKK